MSIIAAERAEAGFGIWAMIRGMFKRVVGEEWLAIITHRWISDSGTDVSSFIFIEKSNKIKN